jgi:hypothetical protein
MSEKSMSKLSVEGLVAEFEKKKQRLEYKYRQEILSHVYLYLLYTYKQDTTELLEAKTIVWDRIEYFSHHVKGIKP